MLELDLPVTGVVLVCSIRVLSMAIKRKDSEKYFAELVGQWVSHPDNLSVAQQKELRELAFKVLPNQGRIAVTRKSLTRGIAVDLKSSGAILDFLNDKPFKLERADTSKLFESWSTDERTSRSFMYFSSRNDSIYPMGILFRHKFKPKEIILDMASDYMDPTFAETLDKAIAYYGGGVGTRKEENEVLVDSYKANVIALCKNVSKFSLLSITLKEMYIYEAIMDRLASKYFKSLNKQLNLSLIHI